MNHFKSKGCGEATGANLDQFDGQGCYNALRTEQAEALVRFVNIISQTDEPDVLIIGDLNAYAKEDPLVTLQNAGYTNLVAEFGGGLGKLTSRALMPLRSLSLRKLPTV